MYIVLSSSWSVGSADQAHVGKSGSEHVRGRRISLKNLSSNIERGRTGPGEFPAAQGGRPIGNCGRLFEGHRQLATEGNKMAAKKVLTMTGACEVLLLAPVQL